MDTQEIMMLIYNYVDIVLFVIFKKSYFSKLLVLFKKKIGGRLTKMAE